MEQKTNKRTLRGVVASHTGNKTLVVCVERFVKHPKYKKYLKKSKRYQAHDEANKHKVGDVVMIEECRPISKNKHFKVI